MFLVVGCHSPLANDSDEHPTSPGPPVDCSTFTTEVSCQAAASQCVTEHCPGCGEQKFAGCFEKTGVHSVLCALPKCAGCDKLDEATCKQRNDCRADYCPNCDQVDSFIACHDRAAAPVQVCEQPRCATPCDMRNEATCESGSGCHAVFNDIWPGCIGLRDDCVSFRACAEGEEPICQGQVQCKIRPPVCNGVDGFTIGYTKDCYEGCVRKSECWLPGA